MTSCADVRENISAYADNELSMEERQTFEEHIGKCLSCKEELDDMLRIIAALRSMPQQELPEGFRAELHEKLTAVSSRQGNIQVIRQKPKKNTFVRTISSIAAGILLIFLGGSIVRFGLFSGGFMQKSTVKADMTANTPALAAAPAESNKVYFSTASDAEVAGIQPSEPASAAEGASDAGAGIMSDGMFMEAPAKSIAADRSVAMQERDNGAKMETIAETAASKSSSVTITAKDVEAAIGKVTELANVNNGMAADYGADSGLQKSSDTTAMYVMQDDTQTQKQLQYVFTEADYSAFITALNDTFGAADVQTGAFISEDMTDSINMLINQSENYDIEIQRLQKDNAAKNSEEISKLKKEKESIDGQIERIRLYSDFVTVTVYVNMK